MSITKEKIEYFINNEFHILSSAQKYSMINNPHFIESVLTIDPLIFRDFANKYFSDPKLVEGFFSNQNKPIISRLDQQKVAKSLSYLYNFKDFYKTLLDDNNYYLLNNEHLNSEFGRVLISVSYENNPSLTNEFILKHPDYIIKNNLLTSVKVSNKITSYELEAITSLKTYLNADENSKFYSKFSMDVINSLIDNGYYSLLSNRDKKEIYEKYIEYKNLDYGPLSINAFKNKDFIAHLINNVNSDSNKIVNLLNYVQESHPEIYDTYHKIFHNLISKKENKTIEDISFLYFNDYIDNIKLNINIIKEYARSNKKYKDKLDSKLFNIFNNIDLENLNEDDLINLNYELKNSNIDYSSQLYNYISEARDNFANELQNSLTPLNDNIKNCEGVKVHLYDGDPLSFVVHCSFSKMGDIDYFINQRVNSVNNPNYKSYLSASYINDNNIEVYDKDRIIFGFNNIKDMQLISANHQDSFTTNSSDTPTNYASSYLNLEEFSSYSGYSEIVFKPTKLKPDFIVCFDSIDDYDLEMAKKLNIDIVCINSQKYINNNKKYPGIIDKKYKH